jgi:site-specific recombinase XerD
MGGPACSVATLIERYFTDRLMRQRNVSANTIASYRDTFRLLFKFAQARLRKPPSAADARRFGCVIHRCVPERSRDEARCERQDT